MDNEPYSGGASSQQGSGNKKLQQTQAQVDEVVGIMQNNIAKVLERDSKLSELDRRADNLQVGASQFEQKASKLKRKYWWKNLKMMIIIGIIAAIILIIIIVSITSSFSDDSHPQPAVSPAPPAASISSG